MTDLSRLSYRMSKQLDMALNDLNHVRENIDEINDETIALYYESKLLYEDNIRNMHKILDVRYNRRTVKRVITELGKGIYPHGKQFSCEELKEFGLNVKKGIPTKIKKITDLFLDLI